MTATDMKPLSRLVRVKDIPGEGLGVNFNPTPDEQAALAKFPGIHDMRVQFRLNRKGSRVTVTGTVAAKVTQTCVVSLDEFDSEVSEEVEALFDEKIKEPVDENALDEDAPDPIYDGMIDVGIVAGEFLALGLDLYPRKPGAVFEFGAEPDEEPSPFSALAKLRTK